MARKCKGKTVLIVEDDTDARNFASRVLELEGYHVIQAEDGDEGLRLVRENQVAIVILDLKLNGRDGWAVLEQINGESELSSIPVIIFTASAGVSQRDKALGMGAADYLVKPLSAVSLREAVIHTLRQARRGDCAIKKSACTVG